MLRNLQYPLAIQVESSTLKSKPFPCQLAVKAKSRVFYWVCQLSLAIQRFKGAKVLFPDSSSSHCPQKADIFTVFGL